MPAIASQPPIAISAPHEVFIKGEITETAVNYVIRRITADKAPNPVVDVTSAGGQALPAIKLGYFLHEHNATIRVVGLCASACAQYLFLGARKRVIVGHSLVLFHGTPTLLRSAYQASGRQNEAAGFNVGTSAEYRFYKAVGVHYPVDKIAWVGLKPICLNMPKTPLPNNPDQYTVLTRSVVYTFERSMLHKLQLSISGFWPENYKQLGDALRVMPFKQGFTVHLLSSSEIAKNMSPIRPLPLCP